MAQILDQKNGKEPAKSWKLHRITQSSSDKTKISSELAPPRLLPSSHLRKRINKKKLREIVLLSSQKAFLSLKSKIDLDQAGL